MTVPPLARSELWWLRIAAGDLASARAVLDTPDAPPRVAAYLAHQTAEKALKAAIASDGDDPPWSHDLIGLRARTPQAVRARIDDGAMRSLYRADVKGRYPDDEAALYAQDEVGGLVADAEAVVDVVAGHLESHGLGAARIEPA